MKTLKSLDTFKKKLELVSKIEPKQLDFGEIVDFPNDVKRSEYHEEIDDMVRFLRGLANDLLEAEETYVKLKDAERNNELIYRFSRALGKSYAETQAILEQQIAQTEHKRVEQATQPNQDKPVPKADVDASKRQIDK